LADSPRGRNPIDIISTGDTWFYSGRDGLQPGRRPRRSQCGKAGYIDETSHRLDRYRGFQTHGLDERVEIVDDTLAETIQLGSPLRIKLCVLL
jgi:hypothetical protein